MRIRHTIFIAVTGLCLFAVPVSSQKTDQPNNIAVERTSLDQRVDELKKASIELFKLLQAKDHEKFAELTAPEVIEKIGGRQKYIALLKSNDGSDKVFEKEIFTAGDPHEIVAHNNKLFAVVPFTLEAITAKKTVIKTTASMVGISTNDGKTWKFISDDAFFEFFPELEGKLTIPKKDISVTTDKQ